MKMSTTQAGKKIRYTIVNDYGDVIGTRLSHRTYGACVVIHNTFTQGYQVVSFSRDERLARQSAESTSKYNEKHIALYIVTEAGSTKHGNGRKPAPKPVATVHMDTREKTLAEIIETFPSVFGLRGFPGKLFQINTRMSYVSGDLGPQLVVDIIVPETGNCLNFSRCSVYELETQIVEGER